MPLDYIGVNNGLFTHLGRYIQYFNSYLSDANNTVTGLDADRRVILDALNKGPQFVATEGLTGDYENWKEQIAQRRATLAQFMANRLQDPPSVLNQIGAVSTDITEILTKLIMTMRDEGATVFESGAFHTGVSQGVGNSSANGLIAPTLVLDGVTSPGSWNGLQFPPMLDYFGRNTQLIVPTESMTLRCIDSGSSSGLASFIWEGMYPDPQGQFGLNAGGSGQIAIISDIHQDTESIIKNPDFETLTAPNTIPDNWTAISGSSGTIAQNTNLTNVSFGKASLKFTSTGGATIGVSQPIDRSTLTNCRRYMASAQVKADASTPGTLTISLEGTGFSVSNSIALSTASSGFKTVSYFANIPKIIPADLKFVIKWTSITGSGKNVYIDDLGFGPVTYGGGLGLAITRGSVPFALGDRFSFQVGYSNRGIFQAAFRDIFGVQLPTSSVPTIPDSLAEPSTPSSSSSGSSSSGI
jgi:hypothetical protein